MDNIKMNAKFTLERKHSEIMLRFEGKQEEIPVKIMWARPLTGKGKEICCVGKDKKEVALIQSVETLDPSSQLIIKEALSDRYLIPKVKRVHSTHAEFGTRYWDVETEIGRRTFAMREPHRNILWVTTDNLILRDTIGNRYEIDELSKLDKRSQLEVEKMT